MAIKTLRKALITGVTGQDGSYLSELLLDKGYMVYGLVRRTSSLNRQRIDHLRSNKMFKMIYGDLCDSSSLHCCIRKILPDEIYNLAAQSHVGISFEQPEYTSDATGLGVIRILEAVKAAQADRRKKIRFYQASSSELFGKAREFPQSERTPFYPRSPYACAKLYAFWITKNYRESYGIFAANGILFNHESPRRGENFVTRKITREVTRIKEGLADCLYLGNLDAKRDWGHARDYVKGMWLILQQEIPDDFVLATGESHTVREFLELSLKEAGIKAKSNGKSGVQEEYIDEQSSNAIVRINPGFYRPAEVDSLLGDASKARSVLGWRPSVSFKALVKEMVASDRELLNKEMYGCNGKRP